jgi:TolB-like protein
VSSFIALLLAVAPASPKIPNVAVTTFSVVDLSAERAEFYTEHFADRLADQGLRVVTPREISTLIGMERQRALLGCGGDASSSCLVEMANALGVDGVVLGTVAKVGTEFQVNLKIIAADNGRRLATHSAKVGSEGAIVDSLTEAARSMAGQLGISLRPPGAQSGARSWWWLPASIGVLAAAGGTVGLVVAENSRARLAGNEQLGPALATEVLDSGKTARTLGWVGVGVGAVALGTAAALLVAGGPSASVTPVATVTSDGASIGFVGRLP